MPRGFSDVRQNGDSTGEGTVSDNIGLSFVYLMCLSFCIFILFYFCFIHAFLKLFHASPVFIFESTHKLLSQVRVQMRETPHSYLSVCLIMVGIRTLTVSCNAPILSLRRSSLGRYETLLRPDRKPTHVHIMNRTCPQVVCAIVICIRANPS